MKNKFRFRRSSFFGGVNPTVALACGALALVCGSMFAVSGFDKEIYNCFRLPEVIFPPFFMLVAWIIYVFLLGCTAAVICGENRCREDKREALISVLLIIVLTFIWFPLVYTAAAFFSAFLLSLVIAVLSLRLYLLCRRYLKTVSYFCIAYCAWLLYCGYYCLSLFFSN